MFVSIGLQSCCLPSSLFLNECSDWIPFSSFSHLFKSTASRITLFSLQSAYHLLLPSTTTTDWLETDPFLLLYFARGKENEHISAITYFLPAVTGTSASFFLFPFHYLCRSTFGLSSFYSNTFSLARLWLVGSNADQLPGEFHVLQFLQRQTKRLQQRKDKNPNREMEFSGKNIEDSAIKIQRKDLFGATNDHISFFLFTKRWYFP